MEVMHYLCGRQGLLHYLPQFLSSTPTTSLHFLVHLSSITPVII
ncbi:hypothetical protein KSS87_012181, partial [Heliosperma pusillum]